MRSGRAVFKVTREQLNRMMRLPLEYQFEDLIFDSIRNSYKVVVSTDKFRTPEGEEAAEYYVALHFGDDYLRGLP